MRKLISYLGGSSVLRKIVKFSRLHLLGNWWLRHFPVVKKLPGSGIRYRARRIESLGLSVEMFEREELYPLSDLPADLVSFADLGCNVGYFTCWLCHRLKNTRLKGLMVDADADAVEESQWHVEANGLLDVHVLHGLAGTKGGDGSANFFVHTSNVCSTTTPPADSMTQSNTWTPIQVPCLNIEEAWAGSFGDLPCGLLKVDIEGSELDFLQNETRFLRRVQTIVLEWHKSRVSLAQIKDCLSAQDFSLKNILHEDEGLGTAVFVRKVGASTV
jgi:FkbM family methyltransferase